MASDTDLYTQLGVDRQVNAKALQTAYRKLARKHHPDVNPGNKAAEERFKEISSAYDVLSDPAKRKLYDEFGLAGLGSGFNPEQSRAHQRWQRGREATGQQFDQEVMDFDLSDLFGGSASYSATATGSPQPPGHAADLRAVIDISFKDAMLGSEAQFEVPAAVPCSACGGKGAPEGKRPSPCLTCHGSGRVDVVRGPLRMQRLCPGCQGRGVEGPVCQSCDGSGHTVATQKLIVRIPKGAQNGSILRVKGRGTPGAAPNQAAGDLLIETRVRAHPYFRRQGDDLFITLPVTLDEAYNGSSIAVLTPSGTVNLRVPPRSQQALRLRLKGKGVTRGATSGDLYADLDVRLPDVDDPKVAEAMRSAKDGYAKPVREKVEL